MKRMGWWPLVALVGLAMAGCGSSDSGSASGTTGGTTGSTAQASGSGDKPLVAFAQANSADPWRQVFDANTKAEADKHGGDMSFEEQSAEDDPNKQISQIETMMLKQPKVLLVSPATEAVQSAIEKAYDAGTPVVLLDRTIPGDKYTCYVGGDNVEIGREAGKYIESRLPNGGTVLMIQGLGGATATADRKSGAMEILGKNSKIKVIEGDDCKYQRQAAQSYMESYLQGNAAPDVVYAHNDEMAIGAYTAWERWKSTQDQSKPIKKPIFVGIDACQKEVVDMIKADKIDATFKYPVPGPKGVEIALDIIKGNKPAEKKVVLPTEMVTKETADAYLTANPNLFK